MSLRAPTSVPPAASSPSSRTAPPPPAPVSFATSSRPSRCYWGPCPCAPSPGSAQASIFFFFSVCFLKSQWEGARTTCRSAPAFPGPRRSAVRAPALEKHMESHGPGEWTGPAQDCESGRAGKGSASCIAVSAAASGGLCWELGGEVGCYAGVKVGVDPLAFSQESSPNPPRHLGRCATQTVQLSSFQGLPGPLFLCWKKRAECCG